MIIFKRGHNTKIVDEKNKEFIRLIIKHGWIEEKPIATEKVQLDTTEEKDIATEKVQLDTTEEKDIKNGKASKSGN